MANKSLHQARHDKKDEFYTLLPDIEHEVMHYTKHFRGKVVYCNCDDPYESNFFKYFIQKFNILGLKKLITTCYAGSPVAGTKLNLDFSGVTRGVAHKIEITGVKEGDGFTYDDIEEFLKSNSAKKKIKKLEGDGDFRSEECVKLLEEADIVVTNPPFSLFREYVAQLVQHKKEFLIIGNKNAITYKEIFPLIKENKIWVGATSMSKDLHFIIPQEYVEDALGKNRKSALAKSDAGEVLGRSPSIWYTNLDHGKRHEDLILYETYSPEKYPKYDNYDAIEVKFVKKIPKDYYGVIGVPPSFLNNYNPKQFEIIGCTYSYGRPEFWPKDTDMSSTINGKSTYKRLFIIKKQ